MIQGSMVAIVTPMLDDGSVDGDRFRALIDFHIEQGTAAIVAVGTTGESPTLNPQEHCEVIKLAVEHVKGRVPVVAGCGSNSTREAVELSRCALEAGADYGLSVTPYYNKPTQEGLYLHYKTIVEAVPLAQILYNVPGRTACDMLPETVARLAKLKYVAGLKDASGDLSRVAQQRADCGPDFALYSGNDDSALDFILAGGDGVISVTANVAPKAMSDMCRLALDGKTEAARQMNDGLAALHNALFIEANPIPVKWAVYALGMAGSHIRPPLTVLTEAHQEIVKQAMQQAGIHV